MQHLMQNQNRIAGARQSVHPDKHATVSSPRRHMAFKKKRGVCVCVCVRAHKRSWGREENSLLEKRRKFTSGSSTVGHLKERREEHKAGTKALLMRTLMRLTITAIVSRLLIIYIYIYTLFLIVKREENVKNSLIRHSQNLPLPKASKSLPVSVSIHHATLG